MDRVAEIKKTENVHTYNTDTNKCPNCNYYGLPHNVRRHINSKQNIDGTLCNKFQTQYSNFYYRKCQYN